MYRILYVDDEEHLLNAGKIYLERTGEFTVTPVLSAIEGLAILRTGSFDAIVSDYQMPKMDGIEFLKTVRQIFGTIPFILFTGRGREDVVIDALNNGADFYLQKGGGPKAQFAELMHKIRIAVERNRAKDELRESERRFESLLDSIPNISVQGYGPDGIVNYWNKANERLYGYTADEAIGRNITDLIVPSEIREVIREAIRKSAVTGVMPPAEEIFLMHKNGSLVPVYSSHVMLPHPGQDPDFFCLDIDMSGQKQTEAALKESEEKYRNLVNNIQDMVWETTADLRLTFISPSQERITGFAIDEMIGRSLLELLTPESEREVKSRLADRMKESESGTPGSSVFVVEGNKKGGGTVWMEVSSSPILGPDGSITGFRGVNRDITRRIRDKTALKESRKIAEESETLYKTLLRHAPIGFAYLDTSFRFVHINENLAQNTGLSAAGCIGRTLEEVVPEIWALGKDLFYQIVRTGISVTNRELESRDPNNPSERKVWIGSSYPIKRSGGEIIGLGLIVIDITQRKQVEKALLESEDRFRHISETITDFAYSCRKHQDTPFAIYWVTGMVGKITGYSGSELVQMGSWRTIVLEEDRKQYDRDIEGLAPGESRSSELRIRRKDGAVVWLHSFAECVQDPDDPSGAILYGACNDITESHRAETAFRESRELFLEVLNNANDGIFLMERSEGGPGKYILVNEKAVRMLGYTQEELLQMSPRDIVPVEIQKSIMPGVRKKLDDDGHATFESVHRRKDGSTYPVEVSSHMFRHKGKMVDLSITRDITRRKQVENALRLANQKLNLLSGITRHDIRNQLFSLNAYLELIRDSPGDVSSVLENITAAEQVAGIIEHQILFTKEYETLGLNAPVWQNPASCIQCASGWFDLKNLRLDTANLDSVEILADPLLEKVFYNLLDNASRHSGSAARCIRFSCHEAEDCLFLVCEDDGVGIPAEEKELIFSRGYGKNTGFGLFLIREILAITGITIRETGLPGNGARFEIVIPAGGYRFTGTVNKEKENGL